MGKRAQVGFDEGQSTYARNGDGDGDGYGDGYGDRY
jgi:hypothetical protein